jgi:hypothetical protein
MAGQKVASTAGEKAEHGSSQEGVEWPPRNWSDQLRDDQVCYILLHALLHKMKTRKVVVSSSEHTSYEPLSKAMHRII